MRRILIQVNPLGLLQNVPCVHSRNPKYPGCSHDTVFVILEYDWYSTMWLVRSNKTAGGFFGFQNVMSEPAAARRVV